MPTLLLKSGIELGCNLLKEISATCPSPSLRGKSPQSVRMRELLPLPVLPMRYTNSVWLTERLTSLRTFTPSWSIPAFVRFTTSFIGYFWHFIQVQFVNYSVSVWLFCCKFAQRFSS